MTVTNDRCPVLSTYAGRIVRGQTETSFRQQIRNLPPEEREIARFMRDFDEFLEAFMNAKMGMENPEQEPDERDCWMQELECILWRLRSEEEEPDRLRIIDFFLEGVVQWNRTQGLSAGVLVVPEIESEMLSASRLAGLEDGGQSPYEQDGVPPDLSLIDMWL